MKKISRRSFLAAAGLSVAALALTACGGSSASTASSVASSAAASEQPAAAASAITWDDIFATSYSQANRGSNPDAKAPETPEEYIEQKGNGDIMGSMMVGMVDSLNIPEEQFMNNKPAWLGDEPQLADKVEYTKDCEVLVIGAGQAGTAAALRCAEEGLNTICCEVQTWEEYDNYACDLTTYNSKFWTRVPRSMTPWTSSPSTWSRLWATPTRRSSRTTLPAPARHWTGCWLSWTPTMLPSTHTP